MTPTTVSAHPLEAANLERLRQQLSTDIEAMHRQEASLREYEQRLRLLVEHAQNSHPPQPTTRFLANQGPDRAELDAQWEKYARAHALLEAARRGLCDDRLALKDREEKVRQREVEVARREALVKLREQELAARIAPPPAAPAPVPVDRKASGSFTTAPFLAARRLLGGQD